MNVSDQHRELLRFLNEEPGNVLHYAYTETFERIYKEFCKATGFAGDRHALWEMVLQAVSDTTLADAPTESEMIAPITDPTATSIAQGPSAAPIPNLAHGLNAKTLFDDLVSEPEQTPAWQPPLPETVAKRRSELLARIASGQSGTIETRVMDILRRYPETRDDKFEMYVRYWQKYDALVLEEFRIRNLDFLFRLADWASMDRSRRMVQNTLQLFRGSEYAQQRKLLFQRQLEEYIAAHRDVVPEIRFYLDETGNDGISTYCGIGGICVMNWQQYEMHNAALALEREKLGPEPIHFADTTEQDVSRPISLLTQLSKRRSGLVFVGYARRSRVPTVHSLFSLLAQVVNDTLHHMRDNSCIHEPRLLRVVKEADQGFDANNLEHLTQEIEERVAEEFPNQIKVLPVETLPKGKAALLDCADLVASGMSRREHFKGKKWKDRLAATVFNVTGFDDPTDDGMLFKLHR